MKTNLKKFAFLGAALLLPALASAQTAYGTIDQIISKFADVVQRLIPIAFALGILGFFWGLAMYIFAAGDGEKLEKGKNIMIWGLVALFIMASVWGIIKLAQNTLYLPTNTTPQIPTVNIPRN